MTTNEPKRLGTPEEAQHFAHLVDMHEKGQAYIDAHNHLEDIDAIELIGAVVKRQEVLENQMQEMLFPNERTN